jgi:hypothetical protein
VHPVKAEVDWAIFDLEGNQVEVKNLQSDSYKLRREVTTILVTHNHDRAAFPPDTERIQMRLGLAMDWWLLRSATEVVVANAAKPGIEYRIEAGRLNYFRWRRRRLPIAWDQPRSEEIEKQIEQRVLLPGPWEFERESDSETIASVDLTQGGEYILIRIAEITFVYQGIESRVHWKTGQWGQ